MKSRGEMRLGHDPAICRQGNRVLWLFFFAHMAYVLVLLVTIAYIYKVRFHMLTPLHQCPPALLHECNLGDTSGPTVCDNGHIELGFFEIVSTVHNVRTSRSIFARTEDGGTAWKCLAQVVYYSLS